MWKLVPLAVVFLIGCGAGSPKAKAEDKAADVEAEALAPYLDLKVIEKSGSNDLTAAIGNGKIKLPNPDKVRGLVMKRIEAAYPGGTWQSFKQKEGAREEHYYRVVREVEVAGGEIKKLATYILFEFSVSPRDSYPEFGLMMNADFNDPTQPFGEFVKFTPKRP